MKNLILGIAAFMFMQYSSMAQQITKKLDETVVRLDNAKKVNDYEVLATEFEKIAETEPSNWLPYYYAAFCNAKIGWLYENDGDKIEAFANEAESHIKTAISLLDTGKQTKELSEAYCIYSMLHRARVFMNPATYGREFGTKAAAYTQLANKLNPDNPRALYIAGWEKFATPRAWGGDKEKAKTLLIAAKEKLDSSPASGAYPRWGKAEVEMLLQKIK